MQVPLNSPTAKSHKDKSKEKSSIGELRIVVAATTRRPDSWVAPGDTSLTNGVVNGESNGNNTSNTNGSPAANRSVPPRPPPPRRPPSTGQGRNGKSQMKCFSTTLPLSDSTPTTASTQPSTSSGVSVPTPPNRSNTQQQNAKRDTLLTNVPASGDHSQVRDFPYHFLQFYSSFHKLLPPSFVLTSLFAGTTARLGNAH